MLGYGWRDVGWINTKKREKFIDGDLGLVNANLSLP